MSTQNSVPTAFEAKKGGCHVKSSTSTSPATADGSGEPEAEVLEPPTGLQATAASPTTSTSLDTSPGLWQALSTSACPFTLASNSGTAPLCPGPQSWSLPSPPSGQDHNYFAPRSRVFLPAPLSNTWTSNPPPRLRGVTAVRGTANDSPQGGASQGSDFADHQPRGVLSVPRRRYINTYERSYGSPRRSTRHFTRLEDEDENEDKDENEDEDENGDEDVAHPALNGKESEDASPQEHNSERTSQDLSDDDDGDDLMACDASHPETPDSGPIQTQLAPTGQDMRDHDIVNWVDRDGFQQPGLPLEYDVFGDTPQFPGRAPSPAIGHRQRNAEEGSDDCINDPDNGNRGPSFVARLQAVRRPDGDSLMRFDDPDFRGVDFPGVDLSPRK